MTLAIMQPYLFPYIGYFQLMNAVDEFVVYDNIQFTKKGWINRNRILVNGRDTYITIPVKSDSDFLNVQERYLADTWNSEKKYLLNKIIASYKKATYFNAVFPVIEEVILFYENNLFAFILNSLKQLKQYLRIDTPLIISSGIPIDHSLKSESKVIEICKSRRALVYINPIGGIKLYHKENFNKQGITLQFQKTNDIAYMQFTDNFIPSLSIIDVMMFNSREQIAQLLQLYTLQ